MGVQSYYSSSTETSQGAAQTAAPSTALSASDSSSSSSSSTSLSSLGSESSLDTTDSAPPLSRAEAERLYEENMELEYAKREGGA